MSCLNDYTLLSPLGEGNFGKVKRDFYTVAMHKATKTQVALKILSKSTMKKKSSFARIKTEVEILKKLSHPGVLALYDVIKTTKNLILVTEYLPGGDLYSAIQKNITIEESHAKKLFRQIVLAMEYCHSRSVVHRDIKPENILLDSLGCAKLADFGLGQLLQDGSFLRTSCGSYNYAAPEVISGEKYFGPEVDIWSAGVVLYVMVAGVLPFDDENIAVLSSKIRTGSFSTPFWFSAPLKDLLERMLNPDSVARLTVGQIKRHPWVEFRVTELRPLSLRPQPEVNASVLRKVLGLGFSQFSYERAKHTVENNKFEGVSVAYRLLESKEPYIEEKQLPPVFSLNEELNTECSSGTSSPELERTTEGDCIPHDWVYGFRTPLAPCEALNRALVSLRKQGYLWKMHDSTVKLRTHDNSAELELALMKHSGLTVLTVRILRGSSPVVLSSLGSLFSVLAKS